MSDKIPISLKFWKHYKKFYKKAEEEMSEKFVLINEESDD